MGRISPAGEIVFSSRDDELGLLFEVEKLDTPYHQGAGDRLYRLWLNGSPCGGHQWCYDLEQAKWRIEYVRSSYQGHAISCLKSRVAELERKVYQLKWLEYLEKVILK